jgi:hypothetical protein
MHECYVAESDDGRHENDGSSSANSLIHNSNATDDAMTFGVVASHSCHGYNSACIWPYSEHKQAWGIRDTRSTAKPSFDTHFTEFQKSRRSVLGIRVVYI